MDIQDQLDTSDSFINTFANLNLGLAYLDDGALVKAAAALHQAMAQAHRSGNELAYLIATSQLAAVFILQGRLREAENLCREVIQAGASRTPPR